MQKFREIPQNVREKTVFAQLWCDPYDILGLCVWFLSFDVNELAWS